MSLSLIKQIQDDASNANLKGNLVYWTITGFSNPQAAVVRAFEEAGLPVDLVRETSSKSALNRAVRTRALGVKGNHHRKVVDNDDRAGFAILNTEVTDQENMDLVTSTTTKAILNKHTKDVQIEGALASEIRESFDHYKTVYTSDQFRNAVLKVISKHAQGVSLRDNGGIYFIPQTHTSVLNRIRDLFSKFPGCTLFVIPIVDNADSRQAIWHSLETEVSESLVDLEQDIDGLNDKISDRSKEIRLNKYTELREKIQNYAFLLSGTASNMTSKLDDLTKKLMTKLALTAPGGKQSGG